MNSNSEMTNLEYVELIKKAINAYCSNGRISTAAQIQQSLAETYEDEMDYDLALAEYERAAELWQMENSPTYELNLPKQECKQTYGESR